MAPSTEAQLLALMFGVGQKKKARKKIKKTYSNWWEKLKGEELKALCRASKLPVSGANASLCERLCHSELSAPFTYEYAPEKFSRARFEYDFGSMGGYGSGGENYHNRGPAPRPAQQGSKRSSGYSNDNLKEMCREKGLQVSGKRFDMVLRLLQAESGVGGAPKRAAIDGESGQPKKRAKSMKLPNVENIEERVFKKFFPPDEVKFKWSNNKHKYHGQDCLKWSYKLLDKEVFDKELFELGEENIAWEVINAILYRLTVGNKERRDEYYEKNTGKMVFALGGTNVEFSRCDWEMEHDFLPRIIKAIKATSSEDVVEELYGDLLYNFHKQLRKYYSEKFCEPFTTVLTEYIPRKAEALVEPEKEYRIMTNAEIQAIINRGK